MLVIASRGKTLCRRIFGGKPATPGNDLIPHFSTKSELADAMKRIKAAGGEVVSEAVPLPSSAFFHTKESRGRTIAVFSHND